MAAAGTVLAGIADRMARRYEAAILYDVAAGVRVEPFDAARAWPEWPKRERVSGSTQVGGGV